MGGWEKGCGISKKPPPPWGQSGSSCCWQHWNCEVAEQLPSYTALKSRARHLTLYMNIYCYFYCAAISLQARGEKTRVSALQTLFQKAKTTTFVCCTICSPFYLLKTSWLFPATSCLCPGWAAVIAWMLQQRHSNCHDLKLGPIVKYSLAIECTRINSAIPKEAAN